MLPPCGLLANRDLAMLQLRKLRWSQAKISIMDTGRDHGFRDEIRFGSIPGGGMWRRIRAWPGVDRANLVATFLSELAFNSAKALFAGYLPYRLPVQRFQHA